LQAKSYKNIFREGIEAPGSEPFTDMQRYAQLDDSNVLLTRQLEMSCSYVTVLQNGNSNGNKKTGTRRFHIFFDNGDEIISRCGQY
jgi:hypothetical protein